MTRQIPLKARASSARVSVSLRVGIQAFEA